jgi:hypothetical protein
MATDLNEPLPIIPHHVAGVDCFSSLVAIERAIFAESRPVPRKVVSFDFRESPRVF